MSTGHYFEYTGTIGPEGADDLILPNPVQSSTIGSMYVILNKHYHRCREKYILANTSCHNTAELQKLEKDLIAEGNEGEYAETSAMLNRIIETPEEEISFVFSEAIFLSNDFSINNKTGLYIPILAAHISRKIYQLTKEEYSLLRASFDLYQHKPNFTSVASVIMPMAYGGGQGYIRGDMNLKERGKDFYEIAMKGLPRLLNERFPENAEEHKGFLVNLRTQLMQIASSTDDPVLSKKIKKQLG